jgi:uncharacterized membrane protein YjgN (DUF898 family)
LSLPADTATAVPAAPTAEPPPLAQPDPALPPPLAPADPVVAAAPAVPPALVAHPVVFHGRADEYFRIWIVNACLTLLTCGVFLAWAKVRQRRYVRGSTEVLGHRFDYRAQPVRLLFGHLLVLALFAGYTVFGSIYPVVQIGSLVVAGLLLPWVVVRSLTFNAHQTVYRGLRFRFSASLSPAIRIYLLEPVLIVLTLGFYYPAWQRSKRAYIVGGHRLGDAYFRFDAPTGGFYRAYFVGGLVMFACAVAGGMLLNFEARKQPGIPLDLLQRAPFFAIYGFGFFVARQLIFARLFNHVWNHTRVDDHRFRAKLDVGKWFGLQLGNLAAILGTAGLLYPWAAMRAHRYAASCLEVIPAGPVDSIQRIGGAAGAATGDIAADFVGLDFGL